MTSVHDSNLFQPFIVATNELELDETGRSQYAVTVQCTPDVALDTAVFASSHDEAHAIISKELDAKRAAYEAQRSA